MLTDIGEYIVGAYLKVIEECDFVDYNVRPPGGKLKGLTELDVIGLHFDSRTAFLAEVTTHIRGLQYGSRQETVSRIQEKYERQKKYAEKHLKNFNHRYMLWSPYVSVGGLTKGLHAINGLELVINGEYKKRVEELKERAQKDTHDVRNPFFRMLQIMECLNDR